MTSPTSTIRDALDRAILADRAALGYLRGLKTLRVIRDKDNWNGEYLPDGDAVIIQRKLLARPLADRVRVIVHEGGHRAQFKVDRPTFERFCDRGLDRKEFFLVMANEVHREDYLRTGRVEDLGGEVFSESYARFALGMAMPSSLREFWKARLSSR